MQTPPAISLLLSDAATILKTTRRPYFEKRIVAFGGTTYLLYSFPDLARLNSLCDVLATCAAIGVCVQEVVARCKSDDDYARHGYWAALNYLPGHTLPRKAPAESIKSLARSLARMHAITSTSPGALFHDATPTLPHSAYLADNPDLPAAHRDWILASQARLETLDMFQLTHGDLYGKNIIVGEDQSIALIDYELLSFDLAGIEFATAMLRPFCNVGTNRTRFHNTYLRCCDRRFRPVWKSLGPDFMFAAAARLALSRKERIRNLRFYRLLDRVAQTLPDRLSAFLLRRFDAADGAAAGRLAERRYDMFQAIARSMVAQCVQTPDIPPLELTRNSLRR